MRYKYYSDSCEKTEELGRITAAMLKKGSVVALSGELGAGKTAFIRGLARGLGYLGRVTSPTFSLVNEYLGDNGEPLLYHFDLYRIKSGDLLEITAQGESKRELEISGLNKLPIKEENRE